MKKIISKEKVIIFQYLSYIEFMSHMIEQQRSIYGYKAQIAEAAQCQRSHLSLVLSGKAHLSPEQALGVANFFELNRQEKGFFLLLVQYARAGSPGLKSFIKTQIDEQLKAREDLGQRIVEKVVLPEEHTAILYSSWEPLAVLISLTIPTTRAPVAIADRLGLRREHVEKILADLERINLVENHGAEWRARQNNIHLPKSSRFNGPNHSHWRQRAVQNAMLDNEDVHYTSVCTLSRKDAQKLKQMLLEFIDHGRELIAPSAEEELYCLTCDWFRV